MLSLRQKLLLGFGGLFLIMLIGGIQSIIQFRHLGQSIDVILKENYRSVVACQDMKEALERMDSGVLFTLLGYQKEGDDLIRKNEAAFGNALDIELHNITVPGERGKAADLKALSTSYLESLHQAENPHLPISLRRQLYFQELLPLFLRAKNIADDILQMNQNNMHEANELARKQAAGAQRITVIFLLSGAAIAVAFMVFVGKWILHPINRLISSAEAIRSGNLDLVVQVDSQDEIGRLSEAFNDMAASLRALRRSDQAKLSRTQDAAQETFRRLPDAVAIADPDGKIEMSTESANKFFGLKVGSLVQDAPVGHLSRLFHDIVDQGSSKHLEEEKLFQLFVSGEERYFHVNAAPMTHRDGRLTGVILIMKDMTQQRQVEEMKSGLVAMVSHQLKTPLTSIRMAVHLLLEEKAGPLTEKQTELLLAAREDSDRLDQILHSLLDISRIESGRVLMECQDTYAQSLVLDAVEPIRRTAKDSGVELKTQLADDLPIVCADPTQIGHVFSNLLSNSLRFTPPGGSITVSAIPEEQAVRFSVADTGSGIPAEFKQRIFEQFFRGPDQKSETGAGLGLTIAKEIVEVHGGTIDVASEEGKGTTISFTLKRIDHLPNPAGRDNPV